MQEGDFAEQSHPSGIAAIQGASNREIQDAMRRFARRWGDRGSRIVGLIETFGEGQPRKRATTLESLRTGARYPIFQDLGPMATACHLDGAGVVAACVGVCEEIERGCDLVILSKFGQLEALRSGLLDAFATAAACGAPILTAVSPVYMEAWTSFSSGLSVILPARDEKLDAWWLAVRTESGAGGSASSPGAIP